MPDDDDMLREVLIHLPPQPSTPLCPQPQIQTMGESAEMTPSRLRPQIEPTEEDAGVACRHCPRQRPQIHASEEGAGVTRRTAIPSMEPASMPDDDDMLREILLRLPPQPSSLPRASAVCKRWRGLVTDPKFHRLFYAHHRKPPLLGVFERIHQGILFTPILGPPDRIPPQRFPFGRYSGSWGYDVLDCRHGLLLLRNGSGTEIVVCDPITHEQLRVAIPPELRTDILGGAVLCAASDLGHVHGGGCDSSPFKVVLVSRAQGIVDTSPVFTTLRLANGAISS